MGIALALGHSAKGGTIRAMGVQIVVINTDFLSSPNVMHTNDQLGESECHVIDPMHN